MARPGADYTLLGQPHVNIDIKCEVTDATGAWIDLSSFLSKDWRQSLRFRWDVDNMIQGTFRFIRAGEGTSLSPFMSLSPANNTGGSYAPLFSPARLCRFSASVVDLYDTPVWHELLIGKVDLIDIEAGELQFRDLSGFLADVQIQFNGACNNTEPAGSTTGSITYAGPIRDVAQQIIHDNNVFIPGIGEPTVILNAPDDSVITAYTPCGMSVWEAIRKLVLEFNAREIRYTYLGTDTFALRIYDPRPTGSPVVTLDPNRYIEVPRMQFGDAGVRNVIRAYYVLGGVVTYVVASDLPSITHYGTKYLEFNLTTPTTEAEAQNVVNLSLADLKDPKYDHDINTFCLWPIELADVCTLLANGVHYDQDQQAAVVGIEHIFENGSGRTTISMRGTPQGAYLRWLNISNGPFPPNTLGPLPLIGTPYGEGHCFGGGPGREGMIFCEVGFTKDCDTILNYAIESDVEPVAIPSLSESRLALTFRRQEGTVESADTFQTLSYIARRTDTYGKDIFIGLNGTTRGPTQVPLTIDGIDARASDVGDPPAAPTLSVTQSGDGFDLVLTPGDSSAVHWITRNGWPIKKIMPGAGATTFHDGPVNDIHYTYNAFSLLVTGPNSCRTSPWAFDGPGTTLPPPSSTLLAPSWQVGYPHAITDPTTGQAACYFAWTGDPTATEIAIEIQQASILGLPSWLTIAAFTDPAHVPTGFYISTFLPAGSEVYARIREVLPGPVTLYSQPAVARFDFTASGGGTGGGGGGVQPEPV